ncbi:MAG: hypothetical protein CMN30_13600 [Sandaracinus sp.]|nr:hypothetical protein [Sandaracinus sp.]|tara:strand:- start:913 stop:1548 length:636 start_codon:yes stop_codon:yes gene_type:complete
MTTGALLLALLEKVDAKRLEVMLDSRVLLHLVDSREDSAALVALLERAGAGAVVLRMLEDESADALWDRIPGELREFAEERIATRAEDDRKRDLVRSWPLWVGAVGAIAPTMFALGCFPELGRGFTVGGLVFAVAVCGTTGAVAGERDRLAAGAAWAVGGATAVVTGSLLEPWLGVVPKLGTVAAVLPALLIGVLVYWLLHRFRTREPASF